MEKTAWTRGITLKRCSGCRVLLMRINISWDNAGSDGACCGVLEWHSARIFRELPGALWIHARAAYDECGKNALTLYSILTRASGVRSAENLEFRPIGTRKNPCRGDTLSLTASKVFTSNYLKETRIWKTGKQFILRKQSRGLATEMLFCRYF